MNRTLPFVALVLLAVLPFLGGVRGDFIEDDIGAIRDRAELRAGGDLWGVWSDNYWGDVWGGLYRPLTVFSYGVDRLVWGAEDLAEQGDGLGPPTPPGVHATNLFVNAGCAVLLFALLARLYGERRHGRWAAWLAAALFAVHPAHVEPVVHLVGRADLLATVFFLGAWVVHGLPEQARGVRPWAGAVLYLLSLLSKESGAALPAVLLFEAGLRAPWRGWGAFLRRQIPALLPYAVALAVFLLVRGLVLGSEMDPPRGWVLYSAGAYVAFPDPAPFEPALTMTHALGEYLLLLVAPLWLSADYSGFPHATAPTLPVLVSAAALGAVVTFAIVAARRGARDPLAWLAAFTWAFLPVSNLVVVSGIVMAERALYLPSIAAAGACAWGLAVLLERAAWWRAVAVAVTALFIARTAVRAPVWSDSETLFEETLASGRYAGHLARTGVVDARVRAMEADPTRVEELLADTLVLARESVEFHPTTVNVAQLAWTLERSGLLAEALERWAQTERADPARRADVERCVAALVAAANDQPAMRAAVATSGGALEASRVSGDGARAAFWSATVERLLAGWIERGVADGTWLYAADGCAILERMRPGHPVLGRHQVLVLEGAIGMLSASGRVREARVLARELERVDPGNPLAAPLIGG